MIDTDQVSKKLTDHYAHLERVGEAVFRAVDVHEGTPFAIRYFDLNDNLITVAENLQHYQDGLLGTAYFNTDSRSDLRWNHYLYFVTSEAHSVDPAYLRAKGAIESNHEYARKVVVTEKQLDSVLQEKLFASSTESLPLDALTIWTRILEEHELGFIVDETTSVPAVIRHIEGGERQGLVRPPANPDLDPAEQRASKEFLATLSIQGFRKYPIRKQFEFGTVNLIAGVNGVGKTSLLEAIEFLFCGQTRRTGAVLQRTVLSATWADSGLTLETRPTTPQAKLRARHLLWYGKADLRKLTLDDSFSKFNFLDSDAAVRLTLETSQERIIGDLAQLLLGGEAAKTLDKLERIVSQLEDGGRKLENDIASRDLRRSDSVARVQQLRQTPHESDQLFKELVLALNTAGWLKSPAEKSAISGLSQPIQGALVSIQTLKAAGASLPRKASDIAAVLRKLLTSRDAATVIAKQETDRSSKESQVKIRLQELAKRVAALDALVPVIGSGVGELSRKRDSLQQVVEARTRALADTETAVSSLPLDQAVRRTSLPKAIELWTGQVRAGAERVQQAQQALMALERAQSVLVNALQRLHSAAHELIDHTGDTTHCPLCKTEFIESELRALLERNALGITDEDSNHLRSELQEAEAAHQQVVLELSALRAIQRHVDNPEKLSVSAAITRISKERGDVAELESELKAVRLALQTQESKGFTFVRLRELCAAAGVLESATSSQSLAALQESVLEEQNTLLDSLAELDSQRQSAAGEVGRIASSHGLSIDGSSELIKSLSQSVGLAEDAQRAVHELSRQIRFDSKKSDSELEGQLREAQKLLIRLQTAIAREQQDDQSLARESKLIKDATAEIEGLRVKLRRVEGARSVIGDLLSQQSQRALTEQVLRENAANIASTFAKIHAPNEFDMVVSDETLQIVRRATGTSVELEEMSSGQRTAYALSLFLAMNERLKTGPKMLMFDDPVSHVDDINTLSFLDHLRNIALSGQRQIFFATADAKLSGLFVRKFRFLGDREFKLLELTRD